MFNFVRLKTLNTIMKQKIYLGVWGAVALIAIATLTRIIPHELNFSPLGAVALFGGAYFLNRGLAVAVPILATFISDLVLNNTLYKSAQGFQWFYDGFYWQYLAYAIIVFWGASILKNVKVQNVIVGALGSSLIFFLVSNFGVFAMSSTYTKDVAGLMTCMAAGIPFIKTTILGDMIFSVLFFGAYALWTSKLSITAKASQIFAK